MTHLAHFRDLAKYNAWMNTRLYDISEKLTDEELRRDGGAFFHSVHGTLNHLLLVDRLWLRRFRDAFPDWSTPRATPLVETFETLGDILFEEFTELRRQRVTTDAAISAWVAELTVTDLSATFRYSNSKGVAREHPLWFALAHLFNHQTHHRGQVTALLTQLKRDPGVTDFLFVEHV